MLYTKKQSDLLKESIKKWVDIIQGSGCDHGADNCALCKEYRIEKYIDERYTADCTNCPVKQTTGYNFCKETPYIVWISLSCIHNSNGAKNLILYNAAVNEFDFLKSLYIKTILFRKFEI